METQLLLEQIGKHWGWEVGNKVKQEIDNVIGATDIDMAQLQSAITTIQGMLDADEGTPEFDVGANIVTQLTDHLARIVSLESGIATLNADVTNVGSVAYAVKQERDRALAAEAALQAGIDGNTADITTLNGDDTVNGSVAKSVKDAVDAEVTAREAGDAALQTQIDDLSGGGTGSIAAVQAEIDATQTGAGLEADGSYAPDVAANYTSTATSLKDADSKLDAAIKTVDDARIADKAAGDTAVAAAQADADANEAAINTLNGDETVDGSVDKKIADAAAAEEARSNGVFVTKQSIADISAATLSSIFRAALDCGFAGETKQDVLDGTGNCTAGGGGGDGGSI